MQLRGRHLALVAGSIAWLTAGATVRLDGARRALRVLLAAARVVTSHMSEVVAEMYAIAPTPSIVRRVHAKGDGGAALAPAEFERLVLSRKMPVVVEGWDLGVDQEQWEPAGLKAACGEKRVSVHVSSCADLAWVPEKNFAFEFMPFSELVDRIWGAAPGEGKYLYLRSVGEKMRTRPADFAESFPDLARTIHLPMPFAHEALFSTALRVSSAGLTLWTHNDMMENLLVQVVGTKEVTLWPPSDAPNLYVEGSSSPCTPSSDLDQYPRLAAANGRSMRAYLRPGDVLYIPPLWYHHVRSLEASVSVNVFWRGLAPDAYARKDLYGNRDLPAGEKALELARSAGRAVREAQLPEPYASFYAERVTAELERALRL
mmetsp:Transcript_12556/g.33619  ORF Transcript_12556/g.33619 Transcript_12556/m.33619 type:complete len:373 (+) Transcript_12556:53-1171(+)